MTDELLEQHLAALRHAFDESFTRALDPATSTSDRRAWLGLRTAGHALAVPVAEAGAIVRRPPITPVPGAALGLLGVGGVGGHLVGLYDLASLLGVQGAAGEPGRWVLICRAARSVGLVFEHVDGYAQLESLERTSTVSFGGETRSVLELATLLARIQGEPTDTTPMTAQQGSSR